MSLLDKVWKFLTKNRGLKGLSIVLAIVTWIAIRDATNFEAVIQDVPVNISVRDGWAVQSRSISDVDVLFRGSESVLRFLNKDQVSVELDIKPGTNGNTQIVQVSVDDVRAPKAIRAIYVEPPEIAITLDRESEKRLRVEADILGQPPEGYEVENVVCTPAEIVLHGPERRIESIDLLRTKPLDLEGRLRSFQLNRDVVSPGDNWTARLEPQQVRVEVSIVERSMRMDFTNVPVNALLPAGSSASVLFFPPTVNVAMKGRSDIMTNISPKRIKAFVDAEELVPGERRDLNVNVPTSSGVDIIGIDPPVVRAEMDYID